MTNSVNIGKQRWMLSYDVTFRPIHDTPVNLTVFLRTDLRPPVDIAHSINVLFISELIATSTDSF